MNGHDPNTISFPLWRVADGDEGGWFVQKPRTMGDIERLAITFTSYTSARIYAETMNAQLRVAIEEMIHKAKRDMIEAHAHECDDPIIKTVEAKPEPLGLFAALGLSPHYPYGCWWRT